MRYVPFLSYSVDIFQNSFSSYSFYLCFLFYLLKQLNNLTIISKILNPLLNLLF